MRTIKVSINEQLVSKTPPKSKLSMSQGFKTRDLTIPQLAKVVSDDGFAFSYDFEGGYRKTQYFKGADFLAVDIDGGQTIEQALKNPFVAQYCSLLYTTVSHTPEKHRFRLVFVLPKTITDPVELKAASRSISRRCGGDLSVTDAARMFYGAKSCHTCKVLGDRQLVDVLVNTLISDGKVAAASDSINRMSRRATSRSQLKIPRDQQFISSEGKPIKMSEVKSKVSVHCPYHDDQDSSAFIAVSPRGDTFLRCSACQLTRFMEGTGHSYEFDSFERTMVRLKEKKAPEKSSEYSIFNQVRKYFNFHGPKDVHLSADRYLILGKIPEGLTCIKSPKGTGKTHYLKQSLAPVRSRGKFYATLEEMEEDDLEGTGMVYPEGSVLLIGHRQALIRDMCKRLDLHCYLDDPPNKRYGGDVGRYGVCLDSLGKVTEMRQGKDGKRFLHISNYDTVLIDESEQVLAHFLSDTIGEDRYNVFNVFTAVVGRAKSVVALDADLGWTTLNTLMGIRSLPHFIYFDLPKRVKTGKWGEWITPKSRSQQLHLHINSWKPGTREVIIQHMPGQLMAVLEEQLQLGNRTFFVSNSRAKVNATAEAISLMGKREGKEYKTITITAENSKQPDIQHFITNIKTEILKYDVVLASPSLGTGVDITFENGRSEIHSVLGHFENLINTHTEVDQQIARVRNPKQVHVYVSHMTSDFETDLDVNMEDFYDENFNCQTYVGNTLFPSNPPRTDPGYYRTHPFMIMVAHIRSFQRASKNHLRQNFIRYKESIGWKVTLIPFDRTTEDIGNEFYYPGKAESEQKNIDAVVNANDLTFDEIKEIERKYNSNHEQLTRDEYFCFVKDRIARFYARKVEADLVMEDNQNRFMPAVRNFEAVTSREYIKSIARQKEDQLRQLGREHMRASEKHMESVRSRQILLYLLFESTPFFRGGVFNPRRVFVTEDCAKFAETAIAMRKHIQTHLELAVPGNVRKRPIWMISKLLKKVGLTHQLWKKKVVNGKKTYWYRLDSKTLDRLIAYRERRREVWESKHGKRTGDLGMSVIPIGELSDVLPHLKPFPRRWKLDGPKGVKGKMKGKIKRLKERLKGSKRGAEKPKGAESRSIET